VRVTGEPKRPSICPNDIESNAPNDVVVGEIVSCPDCALELEVSKIEAGSLEVKIVHVAGEDWGE